ncbi:unnamed protein product [Phyllotreta striolata]|uniref:Uncharacterized protein n=1 Tax=Phyllotreta striolata TaxID=444603 RepID=A0A9N9THL2_PHYSR|nr:unnamed protein product [Phyllotreta striolata]
MLRRLIALILFTSLANAVQRFIKIDPSTVVPGSGGKYGGESGLVQYSYGQLDPMGRVIKLKRYTMNNDPYVTVVKTKPIRMRTLFGGLGGAVGGGLSAGISAGAGLGGYGGMGMGGMGMGGMGMGGMGMGGMGSMGMEAGMGMGGSMGGMGGMFMG